MLNIILLISAILGLVSVAVRAIEAIYELSKTPELNTWSKVKQFVINFFTLETYPTK